MAYEGLVVEYKVARRRTRAETSWTRTRSAMVGSEHDLCSVRRRTSDVYARAYGVLPDILGGCTAARDVPPAGVLSRSPPTVGI